jgi:proprotein convertase subtilisin/kexin type 5
MLALALLGLAAAHGGPHPPEFVCNHNTDDVTLGLPDPSDVGDHARRMLQSTYGPIRITFDFTRLSPLNDNQRTAIEKVVQTASNYFAKVLSVPQTSGANRLSGGQTTCGSEVVFTSSDINNGFQNSDLHIFVTYVNNPSSTFLAYASPCTLNNNYRPNTGKVVFNSYYLSANY